MKKFRAIFVMVFIALFFMSSIGFAQLKTPQVSPYSSVTQCIGLTDVTIQYHRPGVKEREKFGESLFPMDWNLPDRLPLLVIICKP